MLISGDLEGAMRLHLTSPQPSDRSSRRRDKKRLRLLWSNLDELELESIQYKPFKEILRAWKDKSNTPHEAMMAAYSAVPRSLRDFGFLLGSRKFGMAFYVTSYSVHTQIISSDVSKLVLEAHFCTQGPLSEGEVEQSGHSLKT